MYDGYERAALAHELAVAFQGVPWTVEALAERGASRLDRWPSWIVALAMRIVATYPAPAPAHLFELIGLIDAFLAERSPEPGEREPPGIVRLVGRSPERALKHNWQVAELPSVAELAARLELSDGQLAWLADVRGLERSVTATKLRNYRYRSVPRRSGLPRVIEAPKARLKEIQRWVLHEILDHVPTHEAAHGFTAGRSVITHARLHTGQKMVLRLDLRDFFASIAAARVYGIFRTIGYPPAVARTLTGLGTNTIPAAVWHQLPPAPDPALIGPQFWLGRQLATPHLPQGAPTSPALANLAAFRLDRRLSGLAVAYRLRYSRYADDLTFSGAIAPSQRQPLHDRIAEIVRQEGFAVNPRKSILRTQATRQTVCGVVVNAHPNATRREYDRLRAILHNAARHGPTDDVTAGADLRARLRGRIAWIASLNPDRGRKLREAFDRIHWDDAGDVAD